MNRRWQVIVAALAFVGWLSYLGYVALSKNRGPVISHIQYAAAGYAVVADVQAGPDGKPLPRVRVVETLMGKDLASGTEIEVANLPDAPAFAGEGRYLLLLNVQPVWAGVPGETPQAKSFSIVGQQRSPGNDLTGVGPPLIYPWDDGIRKQFEKMPKPKQPEP